MDYRRLRLRVQVRQWLRLDMEAPNGRFMTRCVGVALLIICIGACGLLLTPALHAVLEYKQWEQIQALQ